MPGVSKEQVEQARKVDVLEYLQAHEPANLRRISAGEYALKDHDSLKISNGFFHWHSTGIGGNSALDFLVKVRGVDFVTAVRRLCSERSPPDIFSPQVNKSARKFTLPERNWNNLQAVAYLQKRGIDLEIIRNCVKSGILYEDGRHKSCVFVGKDNAGIPRFACYRSTTGNGKRDISGSDKKYSFRIDSSEPNPRVSVIAESPIDIMSAATLRKLRGENYADCAYLSLCGTSLTAFYQFLRDRPQIDTLIVSTDWDEAGRECERQIKEAVKSDERLKNRGITAISEPPANGAKDLNDALTQILRQNKKTQPIRRNADNFI